MRRISSALTVIGTTVALAVSGAVGAVAAPAAGTPAPTPAPVSAPDAAVAPDAPEAPEETAVPTAPGVPVGKKLSLQRVAAAGETGVPQANVTVPYVDKYQALLNKTSMDPVRIDIRPAGSTKVVLSVSKFRLVREDGSSAEDTFHWESDPIVLDALGTYEVDVYAKNPVTGEQGSRSDSRKFLYAPGASMDLSSSKEEFSLDGLSAVATGRITAKDPKTGARVPLEGVTAVVSTDVVEKNSFRGKTDADGRFSVPFSLLGSEYVPYVAARFIEDEGYAYADQYLKVVAQQAFVTLTGPTTNLTMQYGGSPVRGQLTRLAGDGTVKPVGAGHIINAACVAPAGCTASTEGSRTRADGTFTITPRVQQPGTWNIGVRSPWLLKPTTGGTVTIARVTNTTRMTEETVSAPTADGKLTFTGKALIDGTTTESAYIQVDAMRPDGTWQALRSTPRPFNSTFIVAIDIPKWQVNGWRLRVAESKTFGPSTGTRILKPSRLHTWFTPNRLPYSVPKGGGLTMKGTLYTLTPEGTAKPLAGQKVHYFFKANGSTTWKEMSTSVTSTTGYYRRTVIPTQGGEWQVRFTDGASTRFNSSTAPSSVSVL
ncbi:hypothetical protein OG389_17140 [Streptomyces sp. NBC_00435]|uniref:hypothetical protein n=1 Tax=Streptomyces sp. NBC_00435 TaxID=2903649 RepID=UPI002E1B93EA